MPSPAALRIEAAARAFQVQRIKETVEEGKAREARVKRIFELVKQYRTPIGKGRANVLTIVRDMAVKYDVSVDAICSTWVRTPAVTAARAECCYRAVTECKEMSLPRIAEALNMGDHGSVIKAVRVHAKRIGMPYPSRKPQPWPPGPIRQWPEQQ